VQAALKLVLEPVFEADFLPCSYGFRPKRRAHDAVAEIRTFASPPHGYEWVLEWTAPGILEALIPGRMQSHACTAEVPR
jgi:retron-type reverse transcriptase